MKRAVPEEGDSRRVLSGKELARELRKAAYRRAKEQRAKDPRYLAMKEAAKERQREAYRKAKERRKAAQADEKAKAKADRTIRHTERRSAADDELRKLIQTASKGSSALN